jgi:hypothetical protein
MSYTNKEELLKLGEIDPELAAVRSWKPNPLRAPSSGFCRSLRSLIYRHPTIRISMPSRKRSKGARRKGLKRSVLLHKISSRPTTRSQYMTAQQSAFESTDQCRLQHLEAHSSSCKPPPQFRSGRPRIPVLTAVTQQVSRRRVLHWLTRERGTKLSQFCPSSRSRVH